MLPICGIVRDRGRVWWLLAVYAGVLAATQLDGTIWPTHLLAHRFALPTGGIDSLLGLLLGVLVLGIGSVLFVRQRIHLNRALSTIAIVGVTFALVIAGFGLQQFYLRHDSQTNPEANFTESEHISGARYRGGRGPY